MIKAHQLYKSYGSLNVLKGLNLEVIEGETLVILGRSGVGKSVLLKLLLGLEEADEGDIYIDGTCLKGLSESQLLEIAKKMGMLFQGAALFDSMTIGENVAFYLEHHPDRFKGDFLTREEIHLRVEESLSMVGLENVFHKIPSELSGGMRKRAALARLIAYRPLIYFYDEPTTGLDPITAQQINELIVMIQKKFAATSIVVTHDIPSAIYVADRMALHENGVLPVVLPKTEFLSHQHPAIQQFLNYHAIVPSYKEPL